jgi:hypothetical protein
VDQIALPYRIALGALLVLAALWFTVLKPGPVEAPAPAPAAPGVTGLGNAVKGAKGAVATANAAGAADPTAESASGSQAATTPAASAAKAKPADSAGTARETRDAAAPLLRDLTAGKVVVLAFLGRGSDDGAVRAAVRELPGHGGRVVVRSASVEHVGDYAGITKGVKVTGAPTVLVLGKGPKARTLTGLTTTAELDQAVGDMLARARR